MASTHSKYCVCDIHEDAQTGVVSYEPEGQNFSSTRDAERWVKDYGDNDAKYAIIKIIRVLKVETVQKHRVVYL